MKKTSISIAILLLLQSSAYSQVIQKTGGNTQIVEGTGTGTHSNQPITFGDNIQNIGRLSVWHSPWFSDVPRFIMSSSATTFQSPNNTISLYNLDNTANNWLRMNFCTKNSGGSDIDMVGVGTQFKNRTAGSETADFVVGTTHNGIEDERMTVVSDGRLGMNSKAPTSIFEVVDKVVFNAKTYPGAITADALYRFSPGYKNYTPNLTIINNIAGSGIATKRSVSICAGTWATGVVFDDQAPFIIGQQPRTEFLSDDIGTVAPMMSVWNGTGNVGIGTGTTAAAARLEVNSGSSCNAGLRLTQLPNTCAAVANPANKVLSVDNLGNVILVNDNGGTGSGGVTGANNGCSLDAGGTNVQLGQTCGSGLNNANLSDDREVPMNNHNIIFKDVSQPPYTAYMNRIGLGVSGCIPGAKLEVIRQRENITPYDVENRAIAGINRDNADNNSFGENIGVYGEAGNEGNDVNIGGDFFAQYGRQKTIGVRGVAERGKQAVGGWFEAHQGVTNYGIYADADNSNTGGAGPSYAGYFNGDVFSITGVFISDRSIKKNIQPLDNALDIIQKLSPKKYEFDHTKYPSLNLPNKTVNYGLIAQELEEVLPTLVSQVPVPNEKGKEGFSDEKLKGVNYVELIPILLQGIKEQQTEISTLKAENESNKAKVASLEERFAMLEASVTNICENGCPGLTKKQTSDNASADEKDKLFQSIPNPTGDRAIINYFLVRNYTTAAIVIASMEGKVMKTIALNPQVGNGSISVDMGEFASNTYVYSLLVNGQLADSKTMTVAKQ